MLQQSLYDPLRTWEENFKLGPFGVIADKKVFKSKGKPIYTFLGHKVYLPFGMPAGPLPTARHIKAAFNKGFDVNVYKTQRSVPFPVNAFPNVLYLDVDGDLTLKKAAKPVVGRLQTNRPYTQLTITNSFGNPSVGPDFWKKDLKKAVSYAGPGQLLIMSVVGTIKQGFTESDYWDDFAETARIAADTGVKVIELNLSCPNVATEGVLCYSVNAVVEIAKRTKSKVDGIPLIAKLGYFSKAQEPLLEKIIKQTSSYISAFAAINTLAAPVVNDLGEQALPGPNRLKSGVCGAGVKWAGIDMVKRLAKLRKKLKMNFEIVGVGGVMTVADFNIYRKAGADAVMSATGAMWNPLLAQEIKKNI